MKRQSLNGYHLRFKALIRKGLKVRVKAQIDFIKYHYETECTVGWNENLSETKIKNASITAV